MRLRTVGQEPALHQYCRAVSLVHQIATAVDPLCLFLIAAVMVQIQLQLYRIGKQIASGHCAIKYLRTMHLRVTGQTVLVNTDQRSVWGGIDRRNPILQITSLLFFDGLRIRRREVIVIHPR